MRISAIKGVKDILPDKAQLWQHVEKTAGDVFSCFGFEEIKIPVIEKTALFIKSIGDTTDIVEKEMYSFKHRGEENITLRPEGTASVVRAFVEHRLYNKFQVNKLWYFGPMFRCERPQAGRYRQFYQVGAEAFGSDSPLIDAEIICMLMDFFKRLNIEGLETHVNSLGCKKCRHKFLDTLKNFIKANLALLCKDCNRRYIKNPLRILDCKVKGCIDIVVSAPVSQDYICDECREHHKNFLNRLAEADIGYTLNHRLVRGLDYYTRTAFEILDNRLGSQNAVAGGGRYDNLVEDFGGPPTPAAGFAIGVERLVSLLGDDICNQINASCKGFMAVIGETPYKESFKIACMLRREGIKIERSYEQSSLKSQMRKASRYNARYVLILGEDELTEGKIVIKDMSGGSQEAVLLIEAAGYIKEKFLTDGN